MSSSSEATNLVYESTFSSTILINVVLVVAVLILFFAFKSLCPSFYEPMRHLRNSRSKWGDIWFVDVFLQPYEQFAKRGNLALIYVIYQTMLLSLFFVLSLLALTVLMPSYYFGTDQSFVINHATGWSKFSLPHMDEDSMFYILVYLVCIVYSLVIMSFYERFHRVYIYFRQKTLRRSCPQNYTVLLSYLPATIPNMGTLERVAREAYGPDLAKVVPVPKGCKEFDARFSKLAAAARGETLARHRTQHWRCRITYLENEVQILTDRIAFWAKRMYIAVHKLRRRSPGVAETSPTSMQATAASQDPDGSNKVQDVREVAETPETQEERGREGSITANPPDHLTSPNLLPEQTHIHPFKYGVLRTVSITDFGDFAAESSEDLMDDLEHRDHEEPGETGGTEPSAGTEGELVTAPSNQEPQDLHTGTPSHSRRTRIRLFFRRVWKRLCLVWEIVRCSFPVAGLAIMFLLRRLDLACTKSYHSRAIAAVRRCVSRERELRLSCLVLAAKEGLTLDYLFSERGDDSAAEEVAEARRQLLSLAQKRAQRVGSPAEQQAQPSPASPDPTPIAPHGSDPCEIQKGPSCLVGDLHYPPFSPGFLPSHIHEYDKLVHGQRSYDEDWKPTTPPTTSCIFCLPRRTSIPPLDLPTEAEPLPALLPDRMELKTRYAMSPQGNARDMNDSSLEPAEHADAADAAGAIQNPEHWLSPELVERVTKEQMLPLHTTRALLHHALALRGVKLRRTHASGKVYNHAFLVFRTQNSASLASQTLLYRNDTEPSVSLAPEVSKIQWKNINTPLYKRSWLMVVFALVALLVFVVYFVPQTILLTVINAFSQVMMHWLYTFVCVDIPGEAGQCPRLAIEQMSLVGSVEDFNNDYGCLICYKLTSLVITYIPSLISAIVMSLLPIIMRGLAEIPGYVSISDKRNTEYRLIFYFLIVIQGAVQIIMPSALNPYGVLDLSDLFDKSLQDFVIDMGRNLPSQIFNFLNYVITKYFLFSILQLLRPGDIFLVLMNAILYSHSGVPSTNKYLGRKYRGFPFAKQSAYASHMFTIGVLYSIIAPISLPIITVVYAVMTITDRYNILYVYPPAPESDVASQTDLMKHVASNTYLGFVLMIVATVCFLAITGSWMNGLGIAVLIVDLVFVIIQKILIDTKYKRAMTVMPLATDEGALAVRLASELSIAKRAKGAGHSGIPDQGDLPDYASPPGVGSDIDLPFQSPVDETEAALLIPDAPRRRRSARRRERAASRTSKQYQKKAKKAVESGATMDLPVSYMQKLSLYSNRVQLALASDSSIGNKRLSDQDVNGVAMLYTHPAIASSMLDGVLCPAEPTL